MKECDDIDNQEPSNWYRAKIGQLRKFKRTKNDLVSGMKKQK